MHILIYVADHNDNLNTVQLLLDRGADINARTEWGDTAAHYAAFKGTYPVLRLLCEEGAPVDKPKGCEYIIWSCVK